MFNFKKIEMAYNLFKRRKIFVNLLSLLVLFILISVGTSIALKVVQIRSEARIAEGTLRDTISVRGEGKMDIKPDIALISFSVTKESRSIAKAQEENGRTMNKIIENLKNLKIKEADLKTANYSIYPRYEYNRETGKRTLAGYEVRQNIEVKIRDFSKIGQAIQESAKLGANQIGGLNFTIDDETKAKSNVRAKAISDAKLRAKILAKQLGIKLGDIIDFHESGGYVPVYRAQSMDMGGGAKEESVVPMPEIEPGTNEIRVNVELVYEIAR
jgi:uncharacterized protein YggE